jgi:hypothetical protein
MDVAEICLRLVGAFYTFAGYVATRAALTSYFLDRAIAAIAVKGPSPAETARFAWLLCAAILVLAGGLCLIVLLDFAVWLFLVSAIGQIAYLFFIAPRYFDVEEPPDPRGRQQSTNAFVVYCASTAFVLWGQLTGRLVSWDKVAPPLLALIIAVAAAHIGRIAFLLCKSPGTAPLARTADDSEPSREPSTPRRIKVMADYGSHPLWALDDGLYGDFAPDRLGLSTDLTRDLNAWAEAYTSSFNREDPLNSVWSEEQQHAHTRTGRALAIRLAYERPDLMVYVPDEEAGVVQVHANEMI